jgi:hypothetical protein
MSSTNTPHPPPTATSPTPSVGPTINIAEEFGTAKRNLPPMKIVVIGIAALLIVVALGSFLKRAKPQAKGSLDTVIAAEIPDQGSTMVALTFTLVNTSDKVLYVHNLQGKIKTASGESVADAVSAIDFNRYFRAFPNLSNGIQPALTPETKLQPGEAVTRSIVVAFPVTLAAFGRRQSTSVVVWPYDQQVPVVLTK